MTIVSYGAREFGGPLADFRKRKLIVICLLRVSDILIYGIVPLFFLEPVQAYFVDNGVEGRHITIPLRQMLFCSFWMVLCRNNTAQVT